MSKLKTKHSIGSLGKDNERDDIVENVNVRSCSFTGTQNGARIKTWNVKFDFSIFSLLAKYFISV